MGTCRGRTCEHIASSLVSHSKERPISTHAWHSSEEKKHGDLPSTLFRWKYVREWK